jgi:MFS family permease
VIRLRYSVYVILLMGDVVWSAAFPLGPYWHNTFGLDATETGIILASASVAILIASIPGGLLADRLGPRGVTVASTLLLALSALAHGYATGFWTLLAARVAFGLGFGVAWPAGLALLTAVLPPERRGRTLSASMILAGLGTTIGPTFGGTLTARYGIHAPFTIAAAIMAGAALTLLTAPAVQRLNQRRQPVAESVRRLSREPLAVAGVVFMALPGFVASTIHLLVPLRLNEQGISTAAVGVGFSAGALMFLATSIVVTRLGDRAARVGVGAAMSLALGVTMFIPALSSTVAAMFAILVVVRPPVATLFGIAIPLASRGADAAGVGQGAVLGITNLVWAIAAIAGPITAGFLDDNVGHTATWIVDIVLCGLVAAWTMRGLRERSPKSSGEPPPGSGISPVTGQP